MLSTVTGTEKTQIIRDGIYRIECTNYKTTDVDFEIVVYYDSTNELIFRERAQGKLERLDYFYDGWNWRWNLRTIENDIYIKCTVWTRIITREWDDQEQRFVIHRIATHIDVDVDVQCPTSFDRSMIITDNDIHDAAEKYHDYDVNCKSQWTLMKDYDDIVIPLDRMRVSMSIYPRIENYDSMQRVYSDLYSVWRNISDRLYHLRSTRDSRIRNARNSMARNGVNTSVICSDVPIVDIDAHDSASYMRWEQHGYYGISAIKLG